MAPWVFCPDDKGGTERPRAWKRSFKRLSSHQQPCQGRGVFWPWLWGLADGTAVSCGAVGSCSRWGSSLLRWLLSTDWVTCCCWVYLGACGIFFSKFMTSSLFYQENNIMTPFPHPFLTFWYPWLWPLRSESFRTCWFHCCVYRNGIIVQRLHWGQHRAHVASFCAWSSLLLLLSSTSSHAQPMSLFSSRFWLVFSLLSPWKKEKEWKKAERTRGKRKKGKSPWALPKSFCYDLSFVYFNFIFSSCLPSINSLVETFYSWEKLCPDSLAPLPMRKWLWKSQERFSAWK